MVCQHLPCATETITKACLQSYYPHCLIESYIEISEDFLRKGNTKKATVGYLPNNKSLSVHVCICNFLQLTDF